jgi:hypothetical protein
VRHGAQGWQWMGPWQLDASWLSTDRRTKAEASMPGWDKKAWFYAATFIGHTFPPAAGAEWPVRCPDASIYALCLSVLCTSLAPDSQM